MSSSESKGYCTSRIGPFLSGDESALQLEIIAGQFHVSPTDLEACRADYRPPCEPWQKVRDRQRAGNG